MSYTVSTSWIILFPYALRYSFLSLCILHLQSFFQDIDACIHIPVMDHVTFWTLPDTNTQIFYQRILAATVAMKADAIHPGFWQPQQLQVWLLGYIVGTLQISFPYQTALYSSILKNFAQETLAMDLASLWLRSIPFTFRSSIQMVWFSRTSSVDCFCRKSFL